MRLTKLLNNEQLIDFLKWVKSKDAEDVFPNSYYETFMRKNYILKPSEFIEDNSKQLSFSDLYGDK